MRTKKIYFIKEFLQTSSSFIPQTTLSRFFSFIKLRIDTLTTVQSFILKIIHVNYSVVNLIKGFLESWKVQKLYESYFLLNR